MYVYTYVRRVAFGFWVLPLLLVALAFSLTAALLTIIIELKK